MFAEASFVGAVRVERVGPGEALVTPPDPSGDPSANDVAPIPTQVVTMTVLDQWGGSPQSTVEVFKTGDNTTWDSEDPPYARGQVYVIAASARPDGRLIPNGPEGRIEVRNGKMVAVADSAIAKGTDGLTVAQLAKKAADARKARS